MADETKIHEIDVWIDGFTPCLKDNLTGEVVNTEVIRIRRKSFLGKFNRKSGWVAPSMAMPPTRKCFNTIWRR